MQPFISVLGLATVALLDPSAAWTLPTGAQSPNAALADRAPITAASARADRVLEARTGSIRAQDVSERSADGVLRVERFVLESPTAAAVRAAEAKAAAPMIAPRSSERAATIAATPSRKTARDVEPDAIRIKGPEPISAARADSMIAGAVEWRRLAHADGFQVECEILFARSGRDLPCQRVLHVEELCDTAARLVWREMGTGSGRSLLAEWMPNGVGLRTVEWDKNETLREEVSAQEGAVMPLYLIEMLRQGRATTGRYLVFDPLTRALEELELYTFYGDETALSSDDQASLRADDKTSLRADDKSSLRSGRLRTVELWRSDGSLAGRYRFHGAELVAFQWQEGGLWARRVTAAEYETALSDLARSGATEVAESAPGALAPSSAKEP